MQPSFFLIKKDYPHCYHGRCLDGHVIYWERPGGIKLENLRDSGVSMPALLRHNVFHYEVRPQS